MFLMHLICDFRSATRILDALDARKQPFALLQRHLSNLVILDPGAAGPAISEPGFRGLQCSRHRVPDLGSGGLQVL